MLDETFRNTRDNWWIAVRPEITNLAEFKRQFKEKYWSETAQTVSYTHLDVYKRQAVICVRTDTASVNSVSDRFSSAIISANISTPPA